MEEKQGEVDDLVVVLAQVPQWRRRCGLELDVVRQLRHALHVCKGVSSLKISRNRGDRRGGCTGHCSSVGVPSAAKILLSWSMSESPARSGRPNEREGEEVSRPWACLASMRRGQRTKHKFGKDAPHSPHVNARAVLLTTKEKLRSSVPPETNTNNEPRGVYIRAAHERAAATAHHAHRVTT